MHRLGIAALLCGLVAPGGCASPDYGYARQTRNERPYRGGAASVPDDEPRPECGDGAASALDVFGFLAALGLMASSDVDHARGRASDYEPPVPVR